MLEKNQPTQSSEIIDNTEPFRWVTERRIISQLDYNQYVDAPLGSVREFVQWAAHFSGYPTREYGFLNPRVMCIEGAYYAVWEHQEIQGRHCRVIIEDLEVQV